MATTVYYAPTKVIFGKKAEDETGRELKKLNVTKILVHYGSDRILQNGLMQKILSLLDSEGIQHIELGGVVPNPRLSLIRRGAELCRTEGIDFILAIGGGSVIDSAKAIGYAAVYDGDVWDFYDKSAVPVKSLPVGAILTMAAAGSEMSNSSVITNEEKRLKRGLSSNICRLKIVFENPELTFTLPWYQTACGIVDIQMHTMERFLFIGDSLSLTDDLSITLLRAVREAAYMLMNNPDNYQARATVMWASSLSHNGLMEVGNEQAGDWASHFIEHELSGEFDIAHGAGLAIIWPAWAEYVRPRMPKRLAELGYKVFGLDHTDDCLADAARTISAFKSFYHDMGLPVKLSEIGISLSEDKIKDLAFRATFFGSKKVGTVIPLDENNIAEILRKAQ